MSPGSSRFFRPILPGATLWSRLVGCIGALLAIGVTALASSLLVGGPHALPFIVAPVGASVVLVFAVPSSPLAQPWPVVGGNTISALVGVAVARLLPDPYLACGLAVCLAILAMSLTRSLHPPGGAAALTAVIGGPAVASAGYLFPIVPVGLNSAILVLVAIGYHRLVRNAYPHRAPAPQPTRGAEPPPLSRVGFSEEDVEAALSSMHEAFDIDRDDLSALLERIELNALGRGFASPTCADIMSKQVATIAVDASTIAALDACRSSRLDTLPVTDEAGRLRGVVTLRDLVGTPHTLVGDLVSKAQTASPDQHAIELLPTLAEEPGRVVAIVTADNKVVGLVSPENLLATLKRSPIRQI